MGMAWGGVAVRWRGKGVVVVAVVIVVAVVVKFWDYRALLLAAVLQLIGRSHIGDGSAPVVDLKRDEPTQALNVLRLHLRSS